MKMRASLLVFATTVAVASMLTVLSGCTSSSSGSRSTLYESIDDLARDSTAIVVGTVSGQRQGDDAMISTFEVSNAPDNPQLGSDVESEGPPVVAGDTVQVRQMNGSDSSATDTLLKTGEEYLLFLTPSMLTGDAAAQFYLTGAEAGLYVRDGDEFRRVVTDTGDSLPETISTTGDAGTG